MKLKLALAAVAAFAFGNANAALPASVGMGAAPAGNYQSPVEGSAPNGQAFHAGGVAACDGCHVMHNASNGTAKSVNGGVSAWSSVGNAYLLQGSDQSSTCLICHSGSKSSNLQFIVADVGTSNLIPTNRTPGGDFGWTTHSYSASPGERHGHNVVAQDFGMQADGKILTAPGGTFTVATQGTKAFACSNCHDPHGRYRMQVDTTNSSLNGVAFAGPFPGSPTEKPIAASGSYGDAPTAAYAVGAYRLLAGQNYAPASNLSYPFPNNPPVAAAPTSYNQTEASSEVRVAYGTGMSEWCQNCHTNIHLDGYTSGVAGLKHPAGSDALLHANQIQIYNSYISSGNVDTTSGASHYTSLVPFEQGKDVTLAALKAKTAPDAIITADAKSNVMCLSCHRAHASAFDSMVRWDQNATFLTDGTTYTSGLNTDRSVDATKAGYYDRPVGTGSATAIGVYQRSLCNKCHGKD